MSYPVNNNSTQPKAYGSDGLSGDYDVDAGFEASLEEDFGFAEDQFIAGEEGPGKGQSFKSIDDFRKYISEYLKQVLKTSELSDKQKEKILSKLDSLGAKINFAESLDGPAQKATLAKISEDISKIEDKIMGTEKGAGAGLEANIEKVKKQAEELANQKPPKIDKNSKAWGDIEKLLTQAQGVLDLEEATESQLEKASQLVADAQQKLDTASTQPVKAQALAEAFNLPVEKVIEAAQNNHVDLNNPEANENLAKMFQELGIVNEEKVKEYKTVKEERDKNIKTLKQDCQNATDRWRADSENYPSPGLWDRSFKYWNFQDDEYKKMNGIVGEIQTDMLKGLNALGLNPLVVNGPGGEGSLFGGEIPGQINIGGKVFDIFNEDTGSLTLSTNLTNLARNEGDFEALPDNTGTSYSLGWRRGHEATPKGYPQVTFSSG